MPIYHPRRRSGAGALVVALLALFGLTRPASADRVRPTSLEALARRAGTIVVGRVTEVRVGSHPRYTRVPVTHVTLDVRETWKGPSRGQLTFMQFGDASARGPALPATGRVRIMRIQPLPTYAKGEEILLYLLPTSHEGLTSPVGGRAGKLPVHRDPATGAATVTPGDLGQGIRPGLGSASAGPMSLSTLRARTVGLVNGEGTAR